MHRFKDKRRCFRPHRGLFFYLSDPGLLIPDEEDLVSVPTGDFSFIYTFFTIAGELWDEENVSVPTGDFSFIYNQVVTFPLAKVSVSVPTGDFSFIYTEYIFRRVNQEVVSVPTGDFSFIYQ